MNRYLRISSVIFGILALAAIGWVVLVLLIFQGAHPQVPGPVYSPDGSKIMIARVNSNKEDKSSYLLVYLEIREAKSGKSLFEIQTRASDRMRWSVEWIDNRRIRIDSADIGSYCWAEGNDRIWRDAKCP